MKIAIYGYGNLGRGVECAACSAADAELVGIFTRRDPAGIQSRSGTPVYPAAALKQFQGEIDVVIICGGSAADLPEMTPQLAKDFCVVDSFDTHANIPAHFAAADAAAKAGGKVAVNSAGWDPGMFSIHSLYRSAILPQASSYTFWGKGVSQGHSDAIRKINGVIDARQYTVPVEDALHRVRAGENPTLTTRQKHTRECYVVAEDGADLERITREIQQMPNYFADYDTTVTFVSLEELQANHSKLPHGGCVIHTGTTGFQQENKQCMEYRLSLDSNPEFTASVLLACARAAHRMHARGDSGCKTMLDIPPADLSPLSPDELRKRLL